MRWLVVVVMVVVVVGCDEHGSTGTYFDGSIDMEGTCGTPGPSTLVPPCSPIRPAQLSITPLTSDFGILTVGTSSDALEFVVSNTGAETSGAIAAQVMGSGAANFAIVGSTCTTLAPDASCTVTVVSRPMVVGAKSGNLVVSSTPGGSVSAALDCTGVQACHMYIAPSWATFGTIELGQASGTTTFTASNACATSAGPLDTSLVGSNANDFEIVSDTCAGATIAVGDSCTVDVRFAPTDTGARSASLQMTGAGSSSAGLVGTGVAIANIARSPAQIDFGSLNPGHPSAPQTVTVQNVGSGPTTNLSIELDGADAATFAIESNNCPTVLAPGASCTVTVAAEPTSVGFKATNLTIRDGAESVSTVLSCNVHTNPGFRVQPTSVGFGDVEVGHPSTIQTVLAINDAYWGWGPISSVSITGADASDFEVVSDACSGTTVAPQTDCTIEIRATPSALGPRAAQISISGGYVAAATLTLNGLTPPGP